VCVTPRVTNGVDLSANLAYNALATTSTTTRLGLHRSIFAGVSRQNWPEGKTNIDIVGFLCENAWLNAITPSSIDRSDLVSVILKI